MKTPFPIFINCFNHLAYIRDAVEFLCSVPDVLVVAIDNNSNYAPLHTWYDSAPCQVIRLSRNLGHMAPWLCGAIDRYAGSHYAVTDFDLELSILPKDFPRLLHEVLEENPSVTKCGPALRIDDIPDSFPLKEQVQLWEGRFWESKLSRDWYRAPIDTTLAIYSRAHDPQVDFYDAIRVAGNMTVRHKPWYWSPDSLTHDDILYICSSEIPSGWKRAVLLSFCRSDNVFASRIKDIVAESTHRSILTALEKLLQVEAMLEETRPARVLISSVDDGALAWFIGRKLRDLGGGVCVTYASSGELYQTVKRLTLGLPIEVRPGKVGDNSDYRREDFDLLL